MLGLRDSLEESAAAGVPLAEAALLVEEAARFAVVGALLSQRIPFGESERRGSTADATRSGPKFGVLYRKIVLKHLRTGRKAFV